MMSKVLQDCLANNIRLVDNPYRIGSEAWGALIREARTLYRMGVLDELDIEDLQLLESDAGELMGYNGETVMLDVPIPNPDFPDSYTVYTFDGEKVQRVTFNPPVTSTAASYNFPVYTLEWV